MASAGWEGEGEGEGDASPAWLAQLLASLFPIALLSPIL